MGGHRPYQVIPAMIVSMKDHVSHSLEETKSIASNWLQQISNKYSENDEALVVGLSGHLGAGKTAFTKFIAAELGIKEDITSPTFVIMKVYDIDSKVSPWSRLVHIDAYRLEREEELDALRFEDLVSDKNNLILIEWPENVGLKEFALGTHLMFEIEGGAYHIRES